MAEEEIKFNKELSFSEAGGFLGDENAFYDERPWFYDSWPAYQAQLAQETLQGNRTEQDRTCYLPDPDEVAYRLDCLNWLKHHCFGLYFISFVMQGPTAELMQEIVNMLNDGWKHETIVDYYGYPDQHSFNHFGSTRDENAYRPIS